MKNIIKILTIVTCLTTSVLAQNDAEIFKGGKARKALNENLDTLNFAIVKGECVDTKKYLNEINESDDAFDKKIEDNKEIVDIILNREGLSKLEANYYFDKMYLMLKYEINTQQNGSVIVSHYFSNKNACEIIKNELNK